MTAARFERSRDALVKDFADVLNEADTLLKQASKESGEKANDLRAQVEAKLRSAKLKLQDIQDDAVDRAKPPRARPTNTSATTRGRRSASAPRSGSWSVWW